MSFETKYTPPEVLDEVDAEKLETSPDKKTRAFADVAFYLANGNFVEVRSIMHQNNLSNEVWGEPMVKKSLDDYVKPRINGWPDNIGSLKRLKEVLAIPDSYFRSPENMQKVSEEMTSWLRYNHEEMSRLQFVFRMWEFFRPNPVQFKAAIKEALKQRFNNIREPTEEGAQQIRELQKPPYNITPAEIKQIAGPIIAWDLKIGGLSSAESLKKECALSDDYFKQPEVQENTKSGLQDAAARGLRNEPTYEKYKTYLTKEQYSENIKKGLSTLVAGSDAGYATELIAALHYQGYREYELTKSEAETYANGSLLIMLKRARADYNHNYESIDTALHRLQLADMKVSDEVYKYSAENLIQLLESKGYGEGLQAVRFARTIKLPDSYIYEPVMKAALTASLVKNVKTTGIDKCKEFAEAFNMSVEFVGDVIAESRIHSGESDLEIAVNIARGFDMGINEDRLVAYSLAKGNYQAVLQLARSADYGDQFKDRPVQGVVEGGPPFYKDIVALWEVETLGELVTLIDEYPDLINYLTNKKLSLVLAPKDLGSMEKLRITPKEANSIKLHNLEQEEYLEALAQTPGRELFLELQRVLPEEWDEDLNIGPRFEQGAEIFGYERMFEYINRPGLSRHDALHGFESIIELYTASGLTKDQFFGQILKQVNLDDAVYSAGTAHHRLNELANSVDKNFAAVMQTARGYGEIEQLAELVTKFDNTKTIFSSWNTFKRYADLVELLKRTEILEDLKELKTQGKDKLYTYVETLAFHPDSKVSQEEIIKFWRNPESFLGNADSHTSVEVHNRKKPSNYFDIPHLDLTAPELRDALVEGSIDKIQAFTPLEIEYTIPKDFDQEINTRVLASKALGSRQNKIKGEAKNPDQLYKELNRALKFLNMTVVEYLQGKELPGGDNTEQQIINILQNPQYGMGKAKEAPLTFIAKVNQKSDPNAVMAGDDTACCMPFGSGKNNVYTFNPDTSLFTLQIKKGDGTYRTIAQSVLTKDKDLKTEISAIVQELNKEGKHLSEIIPEDVLAAAPSYLSCDNIEVNPNYKTAAYTKYIEAIYQDFFKEYMARNAEAEGLNPEKVPIGLGYTDAMTTLPKEKNTYAPLAPVGYSDKTGAEVYMLDLKAEQKNLKKKVRETAFTESAQATKIDTRGVEYLTFKDTLPVSYLEGKIYADNKSLIVNMHNIENSLIAKDINNAAKDRPNMSLKYTDDKGITKGYMLAYEGVEAGASVLYVADLAADKTNVTAGGRLIQGFTELYRKNYLENNRLLPVFAEARETTSFKIIQKQLERISKDLNITFDLEELPVYSSGQDIMHPVMIRPRMSEDLKHKNIQEI